MKAAKSGMRIAYARNGLGLGAGVFPAIEKALFRVSASDHSLAPVVCDTDAMALMAVAENRADSAVLPFYTTEAGYFFPTLFELKGAFDVVATRVMLVDQRGGLGMNGEGLAARKTEQLVLIVERAKSPNASFDKFKFADARAQYLRKRLFQILQDEKDSVGASVILRCKCESGAAGTGDIEAFLNANGVRYDAFDLPGRSRSDAPSARILIIEFDARDLDVNPLRLPRGSVAKGALKKAFARWKGRSVDVLGAFPLENFHQAPPTPRRWWVEGAHSAIKSFGDAFFARGARFMGVVLLLAVVVAFLIWLLAKPWAA